MKRTLIYICLALLTVSSYGASDICKKRNTAVILLSKSTNGTTATSNASEKTWTVTYGYTTLDVLSTQSTTISGNAACNEISGSVNTSNTGLFTTASDEGLYCWCEMMAPAHSYWTFAYTYTSNTDCASGCAAKCADLMQTSTAFRTGVFESIW